MRVLAITPNYPPLSRVGAWLATHQLMRHLVLRGHQVNAFACWERANAWTIDGVHVDTTLRGRIYAETLAAEADVIVSHFGDEGFGAEVAQRAGKPSVRLAHGGGPHGTMGCDLAVFNSNTLREQWGDDTPSIVIHPWTNPDDHRVAERGDSLTLVNCSRAKGSKTLHRLAERLPARPFLAVQGGYGDQEGKEIARRQSNVKHIITQVDMRNVWRQTRILLMPSEFETWGMAGVEAMASGIPVIAHATPGLVESLGSAGMFADRDDIDAWVEHIERLADPAEYSAASAAALARSRQLSASDDRDRFAEALEQLVKEVATA